MGLKVYLSLNEKTHYRYYAKQCDICYTGNLKKRKKKFLKEKCKEIYGGRKFCYIKRCFNNWGSID